MNYIFKDLDIMLMDDLIMFICMLEFWNLLENVDTLLRNKYEKAGNKWGDLASIAFREARGAIFLQFR